MAGAARLLVGARAWARNARPVFIVGVPRSGSTVLLRVVAQSGSFASPAWRPETDAFVRPAQIRSRLADPASEVSWYLDGDVALRRACRVALLPFDALRALSSRLRRILGMASFHVGDARASDDWALSVYFRASQLVHDGSRVVEKTPGHVFAVDSIVSVFPRASIVATMRHPVDVLASMRRRYDADPSGGEWMSMGIDDFVAFYDRHAMAVDEVMRRHPDRTLLVTYERLVTDNVGVLDEVSQHVGETLVDHAAPRAATSAGHDVELPLDPLGSIVARESEWTRWVTDDEARTIENATAPHLAEFGLGRRTTP